MVKGTKLYKELTIHEVKILTKFFHLESLIFLVNDLFHDRDTPSSMFRKPTQMVMEIFFDRFQLKYNLHGVDHRKHFFTMFTLI